MVGDEGLKERVVVIRDPIKNALIPVVSPIGLQLPILVAQERDAVLPCLPTRR